jgi:hypothetical protein
MGFVLGPPDYIDRNILSLKTLKSQRYQETRAGSICVQLADESEKFAVLI